MIHKIKDIWKDANSYSTAKMPVKLWRFWKCVYREIEQWVLIKTGDFRLKHSKKLYIHSLHLFTENTCWDDLYIHDEWNLWLPVNFTLESRLCWEEENRINKEVGEPEEPWQDVRDCHCENCKSKEKSCYRTYCFKSDYLRWEDYAEAVRKQLSRYYGEEGDKKEFELRFTCVSRKWLDDETQKWIDWKASGSPPFNVEMTPRAEADLKEISEKDPKASIVIDKAIDDLKHNPFQ